MAVEGRHVGVGAALDQHELVVLGNLLGEAHAAVAEDAALAVDRHERRELHWLDEAGDPRPQPKVMSCSGHSPPLSHTGQSSGWLISRNSTTDRCAAFTRSLWVCTTIPSFTAVEQPVCSLGMPSTSTRHMRQAPTGWPSLGSYQNTGISTSPRLAAST